ncbi:MAG: radical SAM protein, partial [Candidatus Aegiribacteria sp.]|nr:radical SAM protein [Candidatus Aegiribacteria sp.]
MKGPLFVFEITPSCNLACTYCYNIWKAEGGTCPTELPLDRIENLANAIHVAHPVSVTLTGGEPLLRNDLREIVSTFRKRGILVGIATNGLLLDQDTARLLKESGVSWFDISVTSVSGEGYRDLTGTDGFQAVKQAMLAAVSSGARLTVSHIVTSRNYCDAGRIVDLAYAFRADAVALNRFVPGGTGLENRYLLPTLEQLDTALKSASGRSLTSPGMTVYAAIPVEDCQLHHSDYPGITFGSCICGTGKWAISPAGDLRVCEQSPQILGNLLKSSFEELIQSPCVEEFRNSYRNPNCVACSWAGVCGGGCRFL